jgi:hypothetical protein
MMTPEPATDLEHPLPGLDRQRVEQSPHHRHIARAAALLEARDAAEQRAAEGDRAITHRQCRDQRFPLARRQVERQKHQRRSGAADAKRDAGDFAFLLTQADRRQRAAAPPPFETIRPR